MPDFDLKYISPNEFDGQYDLVVNFDGMSTFSREDAEDYANKISKNAKKRQNKSCIGLYY